MSSLKYQVIGAAFELLSVSRVTRLVRQFSKCRGVIFTLHRVLPEAPADFSPNAILQITPSFLEKTIEQTRALGFEFVDLDEAVRRIEGNERTRPFVVLTFDDAYRDNLVHALPVLKRHNCPFTLYVPTAFVDGEGEIWWQALEDIIACNDAISVPDGATERQFATANLAQKNEAFKTLYWRMRTMPEADRVDLIKNIARRYGFDLHRHCRDLIMDWDELAAIANEPLCTIGAHTVHHYELAKLPIEEARREIADSVTTLAQKLGITPTHLSFPIGAKRAADTREFELARGLGFRTAVTTRPGGLYAADRDRLHALPRVSLNGLFQNPRYTDVFLTGALFSVLGGAG